MIFISKYKRLKVTLTATVKQIIAGTQEAITYNGIIVEFDDAVFNTANWERYSRPSSPDQFNPVKSEDDIIRLMKASAYHGSLFFERVEQTAADRKAKLMAELEKLEAEEVADGLKPGLDNAPEPTTAATEASPRPAAAKKAAPKKAAAKKAPTKSSKIEL